MVMNEVCNIIKIENLKEYLSQRGVLPRILNNPRIYELLNQMSDDLNIINLSDETKKYIDKKLDILPDGSILYMNGLRRVMIRQKEGDLFVRTEDYDECKSEVRTEKRLFNSNGIECIYEIDSSDSVKENFIKNIGYIPKEKIRYERDLRKFQFITKTINSGGFSVKRYLMQKIPFMLQNIRIQENDLQSVNLLGSNIDDISDMMTNNKAEFEIMREAYSKEKAVEEFFRGYQEFNRRYLKNRNYEESIAKMTGIKIERN